MVEVTVLLSSMGALGVAVCVMGVPAAGVAGRGLEGRGVAAGRALAGEGALPRSTR
jgi:hypothetical protein